MHPDIEKLKQRFQMVREELSRVIIGQQELIELLLISVLANGHALITGVPGVAKTLTIRALARALQLNNNRIQFTPDLLPSDITGVEILDINSVTGEKSFRYLKGPVFTNILLADEINRSSPRTQSALLEAMQEKQVSIAGSNYRLEEPFLTFATRNPIDSEGVYPLPEAQLDRFLLEIRVHYPSYDEEMQIASTDYSMKLDSITPVLARDELLHFQSLLAEVPVPDSVLKKGVEWIRATRPQSNNGKNGNDAKEKEDLSDNFSWGAGPRASLHLIQAARAHSLLFGEGVVSLNDCRRVFAPVMRHRIIPSLSYRRAGDEIDDILDRIISH